MSQAAKDAAKFLKNTLRLPTSTFPARPPPAELAKYLPKCTDDLYAWQRRQRPASNSFILHDGPPYANGSLHVGHALNKIIKDIICRTKLAEGKRVEYIPGWDCHGLPIELKALEHHGWNATRGADAVSIRKAARQFAETTVSEQMSGFRSWAIMGDWKNHWKTMDKAFELRQLAVFKAMANHGLIYRKYKPVYWSPSSQTALAEAELEYKDDHVSTAALVKYRLNGAASDPASPTYAVIWTTTPWTLPANQAVALNSSLQYCRVKSVRHGELIVAQSRVKYLEESINENLEMIDENVPVEQLLNSTYSGLPEFGQTALSRPILHADFVSAESGTGLVHCAPGHGMEDYDALQPLIRSGKVTVKAPVDKAGTFDVSASPDDPALLKGLSVFKEGTEKVLALLADNHLLVHQHKYTHKYPIDWRTKQPVIIRATAQWFADISQIKSDALTALEAVTFLPASARSRLRSFVEGRSEWCISRQRAWGVPIPALYSKSDNNAVLSEESIDHITRVIDQRGIDAWWSDSAHDPAWIPQGLPAAEYVRGTDTMDVWFDSGTSWSSMLNANDQGPQADMFIEGTDQHRGWFQSSLLTCVAHQKSLRQSGPASAPFKALVTHGFTLDAQGKKMSKSLGNVIKPEQIIAGSPNSASAAATQQQSSKKKQREVHSLGPDALRLWAASSDWTKDVVISDTVIKTVHTNLDKYRVTMKLMLGLLQDFDPTTSTVPYQSLDTLDRLALWQLYSVSTTIRDAYTNLEFHRALTAFNRWIVADLSGFYIEGIKDVLYCDSPSSLRRRCAQTTLHYILREVQSMLGPLTPLLVEESWHHSSEVYKAQLEHPLQRIWNALPNEWHSKQLEALWPSVMAVNSSVKGAQEKARAEKLMGQSLASNVALYLKPGTGLDIFSAETWKEILVVSDVVVDESINFVNRATQLDSNEALPGWTVSDQITNGVGEALGMVIVSQPHNDKCARCWKYVVPPASSSTATAEERLPLCERCTDVVNEYRR